MFEQKFVFFIENFALIFFYFIWIRFVGGMLESVDGPGELFRAIIKETFIRIRDADRFWFENKENGSVLF